MSNIYNYNYQFGDEWTPPETSLALQEYVLSRFPELNIDGITVTYNTPYMVTLSSREKLDAVTLRDIGIVMEAYQAEPSEEPEEAVSVSETVTVTTENVDLTGVKAKTKATVLKNISQE